MCVCVCVVPQTQVTAGYVTIAGTANEMEQIRLFSETESSALFLWLVQTVSIICSGVNHCCYILCSVLWKVLLETGAVSPVCIK